MNAQYDHVAALERDLAAARERADRAEARCISIAHFADEERVRAETAERDAKNFEEALDNVRAALGLESTHWMVVHDDVKKVVDELAGLREVADAAILWLAWYKAEPKTSAQGPLLRRLEAAVAALHGKKE